MSTPAPSQAAPDAASRPLVVDLDGTLIKSDLTVETIGQYLSRRPWGFFALLGWMLRGRPYLKSRLAEFTSADAPSLPYHEPLIEWLRSEKAAGRKLILATASHQSLADEVARHVDLFDEALGTAGDRNLKASVKRDELVRRFGPQGFDYAGNSSADLAVWAAAAQAHVVSRSPRLIARARELAPGGRVFDPGRPPAWVALWAALRPYQWIKNVLIFVPMLGAHAFLNAQGVARAALAFVAFGLVASSAYVLNDLVDIGADRHHPKKRNRPFAAGDLDLRGGWMLWPALAAAALGLGLWALPARFVGVMGIYYALTLAYSIRLKRIVVLDVITLAGLYTLRIIAGGVALGIPLSFWLLAFSMFLFVSLALIKRFSEMVSAPGGEAAARIPGRGYRGSDTELVSSLGAAAGYIAVLVLALYIQDPQTARMYTSPRIIWLACPLLMFWISRAWLVAHRREMHDDPIVFALKDRVSWLVAALLVTVFALAKIL
ncbi:MAG: UbiA family prenyltransferase [Kiritimatiellae bacterium]|nr:UbiA family prenyltransferase [Kiritimatiellia bacterium]